MEYDIKIKVTLSALQEIYMSTEHGQLVVRIPAESVMMEGLIRLDDRPEVKEGLFDRLMQYANRLLTTAEVVKVVDSSHRGVAIFADVEVLHASVNLRSEILRVLLPDDEAYNDALRCSQ